ncbi:cyclic nucleotide-binding domain-containing protein [Sphingomonas sp. GCM10030256]|uniref:cyclic nucleotide-binding domain-containing protein n=1 Tax=Sphingomonas sp. GCM10030256 TaxID=3273427 RepID=UPI003607226C
MSGSQLLFQAVFALLLFALLVRSERLGHLLIGLAGAVGLAYGAREHGPLVLLAPFLVVLVAATQAASRYLAERKARFTADEERMLAGPLNGIPRAHARLFLDQGDWIDGDAGDTLIEEGKPERRLFYLASGRAEVSVEGQQVGSCLPGQLVGEGAILADDVPTATVRLACRSRLWSAPGEALGSYLEAHDDVRHALEHCLTLSLREKLKASNREEVDG